jgi:hypothetical protein
VVRISRLVLIGAVVVSGAALLWPVRRPEPNATRKDAANGARSASIEAGPLAPPARRQARSPAMPRDLPTLDPAIAARSEPPPPEVLAEIQTQVRTVTASGSPIRYAAPTMTRLEPEDQEERIGAFFTRAVANADANADGGLSLEELAADPRIARLADRFDRADQDQDGLLRVEEIVAAVRTPAAVPPSGPPGNDSR